MPVKILTTADVHIGRTSANIESIGEKGATRAAWFGLIDYAISQNIDVVVLAGDVVEHANRYFEAASALESGLSRLGEAGITVFLVSGNHDYDVLPALLKGEPYKNVHLLGKGGEWEFKSVEIGGQKIQFAGWSFPEMSIKKDPLLDFPNSGVDQNAVCVGLIHGDFDNKDSTYAPLQLNTLTGKGVDVWVMGHIHKPETFNSRDPLIYYPGSPQALSAKEKGVHGAVLLTVSEQGGIEKEVIPLSSVRYEGVQVDISDCAEQDEVQAKIIEECDNFLKDNIERNEYLALLSFDVILTGTHKDISELERWMSGWDIEAFRRNIEGLKVSVRKVSHQCRTKIEDLENLSKEPSPAGLLAKAIMDLESGETSAFLDSLKKEGLTSIKALNSHSTFLPLRDSEKMDQLDENDIDELLLQECHRLLSELMQTKAEG